MRKFLVGWQWTLTVAGVLGVAILGGWQAVAQTTPSQTADESAEASAGADRRSTGQQPSQSGEVESFDVRIDRRGTFIDGQRIGGASSQPTGGGPADEQATRRSDRSEARASAASQTLDQRAMQRQLDERQQSLDQRKQTLDERQQSLDQRKQTLDERQQSLDRFENRLEAWQAELQVRQGGLDDREAQGQSAPQRQFEPSENYQYDAPSNTLIREQPVFDRPAPREPTPPLQPGQREDDDRWHFYRLY